MSEHWVSSARPIWSFYGLFCPGEDRTCRKLPVVQWQTFSPSTYLFHYFDKHMTYY